MSTKPTTPEQLDEMRANAIIDRLFAEQVLSGKQDPADKGNAMFLAMAARQADEAAGIPTEGLLALMRGEAVIVPVVATDDMLRLATEVHEDDDVIFTVEQETWEAILAAASPWAPKEEQDND